MAAVVDSREMTRECIAVATREYEVVSQSVAEFEALVAKRRKALTTRRREVASKRTTMPRTIVVMGSIAAGKTCLCSELAKALPGATLVEEPFAENPYLPKFYEEPRKYAQKTQLEFLRSRGKQQQQHTDATGTLIMDRTLDDDKLFAQLQLRLGNMDDDEYAEYAREWAKVVAQRAPLTVDTTVYVYLHAPPAVCLERVRQRGRDFEASMTLEYLENLGALYEEHARALERRNARVLRLDWTRFGATEAVLDRIVAICR